MRAHDEVTVTGAGYSDPIYIDYDVNLITVALIFESASTAYIETTLSSVADVTAETAVWEIWSNGTVSVYTSDTAYAPTAIRVRNLGAGIVTMVIRGN